jgi:hypothetical protein
MCLALVACCWTIAKRPPEPKGPPSILSRLPASMVSASTTTAGCIVYDFHFAQAHDQILIEVGVPIVRARFTTTAPPDDISRYTAAAGVRVRV